MEELFLIQTDKYEILDKAYKNFKKSPRERITKNYVQTRLESAEGLFQEFKETHKEITITISREDKTKTEYFTAEVYQVFEQLFYEYKTCLKDCLDKLCPPKPTITNIPETVPSTSSTPTPSFDIQLPRINLPTFSGKYEEWQTFYDLFRTLIHENKHIAGVQKLQLLKSYLVGEPECLLRNLSTTENNYEEAWNQLKKRYNNKRYNCNLIMKNLFSQKSMNFESAIAMKSLLDTTNLCLKSLENLDINVSNWDAIVIYLVVSKLDVESHRQWEIKVSELAADQLPKWNQLTSFLESRFRSLEMIETNRHNSRPVTQSNSRQIPTTGNIRPNIHPKAYYAAPLEREQLKLTMSCPMCSGQHYLFQCKEFALKTQPERQEFIQRSRLCFNCFAPSHAVKFCRLVNSCRRCGRRHHSLLHAEHMERDNINQHQAHAITTDLEEVDIQTPNTEDSSSLTQINLASHFAGHNLKQCTVLLATAKVKVESKAGNCFLRALLDQGSQASFVTEEIVQGLGLEKKPISGSVSGIGEGVTRIKYMVTLRVESHRYPGRSINVDAYVLKSLTSLLPTSKMNENFLQWIELERLELADPQFSSPGKIDILLGAEVYCEIILEGIIKNPQNNLLAQNTIFGWILSGRAVESVSNERLISMHTQIKEDYLLKKFWELEAEPNSIKKGLSKEEKICEELFDQTTERNEEGRFVVKLPFRETDPACQYGQSREIAQKRYKLLEKKLERNQKLKEEYYNVLKEYVDLNHMELITDEKEINNPKAVYLSHHAVVREDKETTKVRIVFDASCKGTNNVSLNDDLLIGPKLQQDLRHIMMRWRMHKICLVADLVKMYRQVKVNERDTNYQRILWRSNEDGIIEHYRLLTLTFGTACAPYLAVKSLQRLTEIEKNTYPVAAKIAKDDFYMDDLMSGCQSEKEAITIYEEMNLLMKSGGFSVQKWSSNSGEVLKHINKNNQNINQTLPIKVNNIVKVLGICWDREKDEFLFKVNLPELKCLVTKRSVLSDIARLYDSMGWVSPVVVTAKIFIQRLWKANLPWDDELPDELKVEWLNFRSDLKNIDNISIPRWINYNQGYDIELHAFADASKSAFAAVVYVRVIDKNNNRVWIHLGVSKTKVAPIEKEISIPRLELCAALLAAKLLYETSQVLNIRKENLFAWSDSMVVLAWLRGLPCRWTTFVSNRVSEILGILDYEQWRYVSTSMNPADCASRGLQPKEIINHPLWWSGPKWLSEFKINYIVPNFTTKEEERAIKTFTEIKDTELDFVWTKFSNLNKMLRVVARCHRWLHVKEYRKNQKTFSKFINIEELNESLLICIKQTQNLEFNKEIKQLRNNKPLERKSILHTLYPFVDDKGVLRVGGRIDSANVNYDTKHPIVIPAKTHLSKLLIADAHKRTLHGGPQAMLNYLRSRYWIIRARDQVKKIYKECATCIRFSRASIPQLMGQLPKSRLKPTKAFKIAGVDYAGPIQIRFSPGRGAKSYKGYICLFVCMVTRAIHLEVVSDLTAKGFIAAFRRFTSRRGHCEELFSDNGTNFVGADKLLRDMFNSAKSEIPNEISEILSLESTKWSFIPPHAPNFGGLWEAGVRSTKNHLRRVIGDNTLTFEEMCTVLAQIEACLNSRPLTEFSDDPNDPLPLTPGHFLIGEPLINIPDENHIQVTGMERWRLVQKMVYDFWSRWSKEYLVSLNQRYKWTTKKSEPEIGDIVILREDNLPPTKWMLGKIVQKFPGPDELTRVVAIKCRDNIIKRPISKVIIVPNKLL